MSMRKGMAALSVLSALSLSQAVSAMPATTNANYPACRSGQWLTDLVAFSAAGDNASFQAYIDSKKCILMKPGLKVTVTSGPGAFGGRAEFVFQGVRMWTVREGLNYNR